MSGPLRLGLFAASPVHYQAPLYRLLATDPRIEFTAVFASSAGVRPYDGGYGRAVTLDDGLLDGYSSTFLARADKNPSGGGPLALRDRDIVSVIRHAAFDVLWLHGYHTVTHVLAALAQRSTGRGLMFREDQTLLQSRPVAKRVIKRAILPMFFHGVSVVYPSAENRRWWKHWGIADERMFFAPYAVDNARFSAEAVRLAPQRRWLRRKFGIADDAGPVLLAVSRLIQLKEPHVLLEAFRRLRRSVRCALLIVGAGPLEAEMRARIEREAIPDVHLAGFLPQNDLPRAYAAADVFVLPSRSETWGFVVNEAMNFALPVVASRGVGCVTDLVREGETGLVCEPGDVESLEHALRRLVERPDLRRQMGAAGRDLIREWSFDRSVDGIVAAATAASRDMPKRRRERRTRMA